MLSTTSPSTRRVRERGAEITEEIYRAHGEITRRRSMTSFAKMTDMKYVQGASVAAFWVVRSPLMPRALCLREAAGWGNGGMGER